MSCGDDGRVDPAKAGTHRRSPIQDEVETTSSGNPRKLTTTRLGTTKGEQERMRDKEKERRMLKTKEAGDTVKTVTPAIERKNTDSKKSSDNKEGAPQRRKKAIESNEAEGNHTEYNPFSCGDDGRVEPAIAGTHRRSPIQYDVEPTSSGNPMKLTATKLGTTTGRRGTGRRMQQAVRRSTRRQRATEEREHARKRTTKKMAGDTAKAVTPARQRKHTIRQHAMSSGQRVARGER